MISLSTWPNMTSSHRDTQVRLPVGHACLTLHRVVQRQRVEVEELLQLLELHHTVGFVCRPQHQRRVGSRSRPHRSLSDKPPLSQALGLDPTLTSTLNPGPLLFRVGDLRARCLVQVHLPAFFFTLSSPSIAPFCCSHVPQSCALRVIQVGPSPTHSYTEQRSVCVRASD